MTSQYLGKVELTLQPEKVFYKDEGGQKSYYLFVFFVVRAMRTDELKSYMDRVSNGRRKIPVECTLLYDNEEEVEDQKILQLLGTSRPELTEITDGTPEFDPDTFTGSIRYRINKVSMRKDNQGFRLRIALRGLDDIIEPALTEMTTVLSKRKRLRKAHRLPEQDVRNRVERDARKRNSEVEERLARTMPTSTDLIHELGPGSPFTQVPEYPDLLTRADDSGTRKESMAKRQREDSGADLSSGFTASNQEVVTLIDAVNSRVDTVERHIKQIESLLMEINNSMSNVGSSYVPGGLSEDKAQQGKAPPLSLLNLHSGVPGFSVFTTNSPLLSQEEAQEGEEGSELGLAAKGKRVAAKGKRPGQK
mmetsp:Transcript_1475/g.2906  ORF Transcript_1475/g.2906 Transcript_1475/m.2906 type:complete len:363 (-) Transcript_1475:105-1193(-)|eukprot:CAMPEP_0184548264 /NCGR_PEP_ID=MMETSP0199_2-20130426/6096_1 /TAXON_ID=1112570 /ORGANISM="Thraustochytrium sp., Strain LLF1b" /LENGTH=362 /DNA_ID=CAMNT_0026942861 /DNA_START=230 /DNA_END=1318 /DNA_ORIENTATION=+